MTITGTANVKANRTDPGTTKPAFFNLTFAVTFYDADGVLEKTSRATTRPRFTRRKEPSRTLAPNRIETLGFESAEERRTRQCTCPHANHKTRCRVRAFLHFNLHLLFDVVLFLLHHLRSHCACRALPARVDYWQLCRPAVHAVLGLRGRRPNRPDWRVDLCHHRCRCNAGFIHTDDILTRRYHD